MPPLVSICLPVYNGRRYLAEALDSINAQTFTDFEVLIADDYSTDDSLEIAEEYARRDQRFVVWRNQKNNGLFANYNQCLSRASGQFVKLFAQDDLWDRSILERCLAILRAEPNLSLVGVQRRWLTHGETASPLDFGIPRSARLPGREAVKTCLLKRANLIGEPSAVMFPRSLAQRGFDTTYYHLGDLEFWFYLLSQGDYFYIDEPLCTFRRHDAATTTGNLKGLLFALDLIALADQYGPVAEEAGMSSHQLKIDTARDVARFVKEIVDTGEITVEDVLTAPLNQSDRQAAEFRRLSLYALLACAASERDGQEQLAATENKLAAAEQQLGRMSNSKIWRSTELLRSAAQRFAGR